MDPVTIFLAATAAFISAFLWNGPLFGKLGRKLAHPNGTEGTVQPPKLSQIVLNYVVFVVTATAMAGVFWVIFDSDIIGGQTWFKGIIVALWLWLGFNVTTASIDVIWNAKPWKSWLFEAASAAVAFSLMGAILGGL